MSLNCTRRQVFGAIAGGFVGLLSYLCGRQRAGAPAPSGEALVKSAANTYRTVPGWVTTFTYDGQARLTSIVGPLQCVTTIVYDSNPPSGLNARPGRA